MLHLTSCERATDIPRCVFADLARRIENRDLELCEKDDTDDGYAWFPACSETERQALIEALRALA